MATTTAAITLTSADLLTDALSLSATKTLHKAGSTVGLDQTTGMTKAYLTATKKRRYISNINRRKYGIRR